MALQGRSHALPSVRYRPIADTKRFGDVLQMPEPREPQPESGEWWRTRSDDELHYFADGNVPGSRVYEAAMAELGRREAKADQKRQLFWIKLTFWSGIALGVVGVGATMLT